MRHPGMRAELGAPLAQQAFERADRSGGAGRAPEAGQSGVGLRGFFRGLERRSYKVHVRVFLSRWRGYTTCPDCHGGRLRQEARDVRVGGRTLPEVCALPVKEAAQFFEQLELTPEQTAIADKVLLEIRRRPPSVCTRATASG